MTLPVERTRSVKSACDFLLRLAFCSGPQQIKRVPKAVREEARRILRHYPTASEIERMAEAVPELLGP